ncbi:MAG: hypothetical protein PVJ42_10410, partial [bacterium]
MFGRLLTISLVLLALGLVVGCGGQSTTTERPATPARQDSPDVSEIDKQYYIGAEYLKNEMYVEAQRAFKEVLEMDPDYEKAYRSLG